MYVCVWLGANNLTSLTASVSLCVTQSRSYPLARRNYETSEQAWGQCPTHNVSVGVPFLFTLSILIHRECKSFRKERLDLIGKHLLIVDVLSLSSEMIETWGREVRNLQVQSSRGKKWITED